MEPNFHTLATTGVFAGFLAAFAAKDDLANPGLFAAEFLEFSRHRGQTTFYDGQRVIPAAEASARGGAESFPTLALLEKEHILKVLSRCDGNRAQTARILGIDRVSLWRKLRGYRELSGASADDASAAVAP